MIIKGVKRTLTMLSFFKDKDKLDKKNQSRNCLRKKD